MIKKCLFKRINKNKYTEHNYNERILPVEQTLRIFAYIREFYSLRLQIHQLFVNIYKTQLRANLHSLPVELYEMQVFYCLCRCCIPKKPYS